MSLKDSDGNTLLHALNREKRAYELIWAVYKFQRGYHTADERLTDDTDFATAQKRAIEYREKRDPNEDCTYQVCRVVRRAKPKGAAEAWP